MKCENGHEVEYHRRDCGVCQVFVGYPNVRRAEEMRSQLELNYLSAKADGKMRGVEAKLGDLERLLQSSVMTLNIKFSMLVFLTMGQPYLGYYKSLDANLRRIAEENYHRQRATVDANIHPGYGDDIVCAAVSPDGRGLTNYGPITLQLAASAVAHRASILRENAFSFFERYDLGSRNSIEQPGWRSTWTDRVWLGVAHLAEHVTLALPVADLPQKILHVGKDRDDDSYLEVHVFGPIVLQAIEKVRLQKPATNEEERRDWDFSRQKLNGLSVHVEDATTS